MEISKYAFLLEHASDTLNEVKDYYKDYRYYKDKDMELAKLYKGLGQKHLSIYGEIMNKAQNDMALEKANKTVIDSEIEALWDDKTKKLSDQYDFYLFNYNKI